MKKTVNKSLKQVKISILNLATNSLKRSGIYKKYFIPPEMGNNYGSLQEDEMQYIIAISEVFYFASTQQEVHKLHETMREWTNNRTGKDGYLKAYRQGIAALIKKTNESKNNRLFYELPVTERKILLGDNTTADLKIYKKPGGKNPMEILKYLFSSVQNQKIKRHRFYLSWLKKDIKRGIFTSSMGWEMVAIHSKPGTVGNYLDYTKQPDKNQKIAR